MSLSKTQISPYGSVSLKFRDLTGLFTVSLFVRDRHGLHGVVAGSLTLNTCVQTHIEWQKRTRVGTVS